MRFSNPNLNSHQKAPFWGTHLVGPYYLTDLWSSLFFYLPAENSNFLDICRLELPKSGRSQGAPPETRVPPCGRSLEATINRALHGIVSYGTIVGQKFLLQKCHRFPENVEIFRRRCSNQLQHSQQVSFCRGNLFYDFSENVYPYIIWLLYYSNKRSRMLELRIFSNA